MSLTREGQFEREWGNTPELAKILSEKPSVSDYAFGQVEMTLRHAILLREYEMDILSEAANMDHERREQLRLDLKHEKERLLSWAIHFSDAKEFTEEVVRKLGQLP